VQGKTNISRGAMIEMMRIAKPLVLNPFRMLANGIHQQISMYFHGSDIPLFSNIKLGLIEVDFNP